MKLEIIASSLAVSNLQIAFALVRLVMFAFRLDVLTSQRDCALFIWTSQSAIAAVFCLPTSMYIVEKRAKTQMCTKLKATAVKNSVLAMSSTMNQEVWGREQNQAFWRERRHLLVFAEACSSFCGRPWSPRGISAVFSIERERESLAREFYSKNPTPPGAAFIREGNRAPVAKATHSRYRVSS